MRTLNRRQRGITFVETAAYLAAVSVLLGSGLPSLLEARDTARLESAVAELRTDVQQARSAAVSLSQPVRLRTITGSGGTCTVIHLGPVGSCSCSADGQSVCEGEGRALKTSRYAPDSGVSLSANVSTLSFAGEFGTVTPTGSFVARGARQGQVKLIVNVTGRSRTCRLAGTVPGQPSC